MRKAIDPEPRVPELPELHQSNGQIWCRLQVCCCWHWSGWQCQWCRCKRAEAYLGRHRTTVRRLLALYHLLIHTVAHEFNWKLLFFIDRINFINKILWTNSHMSLLLMKPRLRWPTCYAHLPAKIEWPWWREGSTTIFLEHKGSWKTPLVSKSMMPKFCLFSFMLRMLRKLTAIQNIPNIPYVGAVRAMV